MLALALGATLALAAARFGWHRLRPSEPPADYDRAAIASLLEERSRGEPGGAAGATGAARRPEDRRWYVPPEDAALIFEVLTRINRPDAWCYYSHKPDLRYEVEWPEHPRGGWTYRTNSTGLREDVEVRSEPPDLRILVTGDSHTDGFCDNADSYANRLEASIAARFPDLSVEALNAADIAYSFYNYLGVLEKHLDLAPDVFVVAVHGGNDFREALLPYRYFARLPLPPKDEGERAPGGDAGEIFVPASHQGLLSVVRFRDHPEERALATRAAVQVLSEIQRVCREHGIGLVCVYLPSPIEVERQRLADAIEPTMRALGVRDEDLAAHAEMARSVMAAVEGLGVAVLDTTTALRATPHACFWRQDLHLNLLGHETIARELEPLVLRQVGRGD